MRKNAMVAVVAAVVSLGMLSACNGHHGHGHDPKKLKGHVDSYLKKVGATEEQRQKIGGITDRIIADGSEICKNNQGLGKKFVGCLLLDKPNKEWLHQTVEEKAKELTAFAHRTVDSLIEVSGNLTSEQRARLKEKCEKAHGTR